MGTEQSSESTLWRLAQGQAMRLPTGIATRRLRVREGRLWLTTFGNEHEQAADIWLEAGEEMNLPDGKPWVAEAWPKASFEILVAPATAHGTSMHRAPVAWQRWLDLIQRRGSYA